MVVYILFARIPCSYHFPKCCSVALLLCGRFLADSIVYGLCFRTFYSLNRSAGLRPSLLTLGRIQTGLTLLSLNRSLDLRFQFLGICGGGEDGAVAVDEVHGASGIACSVLAPYTVLVVQF